MPYGIRMLFEAQRSVTAAEIGSSYIPVDTPIDHPARIIHIQNLTDVTLQFSFDGVNDHFPLPANGFLLLDISSDTTPEQAFFLAKNSSLYVKEIGNPTTGSVYFSVMYGKGDL